MLRVFIQHFQLAPCSAKGKPVATAPLKKVAFQTTPDSTHSFGGRLSSAASLAHSFREGGRDWTYLPAGEVKQVPYVDCFILWIEVPMVRSLSHDLSPAPSAPPPPPTPHPLSSRLGKCFCSGMPFFPLNHSEASFLLSSQKTAASFICVCVPCLSNVFIASFFHLFLVLQHVWKTNVSFVSKQRKCILYKKKKTWRTNKAGPRGYMFGV